MPTAIFLGNVSVPSPMGVCSRLRECFLIVLTYSTRLEGGSKRPRQLLEASKGLSSLRLISFNDSRSNKLRTSSTETLSNQSLQSCGKTVVYKSGSRVRKSRMWMPPHRFRKISQSLAKNKRDWT